MAGPGGCGVIVAGHSTAGVFGNVVAHNLLTFNGTLPKSPGAGVVVATEAPHETVADNTVIGNTIYGNGIAGVTIHGHLPGLHMAGNEVLDNNIGRNNTVGDTIGLALPAANNPDLRTTGILVASSTHIAVVISGNHTHHDYYGIYIDGPVRATFGGNHYRRVHTPAGQVHLSWPSGRAGRPAGCWPYGAASWTTHPARGIWASGRVRLAGGTGTRAVR